MLTHEHLTTTFRNSLEKLVSLTEEEWNAFKDCILVRNFKKGEHFLVQGEVCRQVAFVAQGYIRLYYLSNGMDITKSINLEHSFCGSYASFSTGLPSRFNAVAMEATVLLSLPHTRLYALYEQFPAIQKLGRLTIENTFVRIEQREASLLLDSPEERYRSVLEKEGHLLQRVALKHLASYLGMTPETLSRIRNKLRKK